MDICFQGSEMKARWKLPKILQNPEIFFPPISSNSLLMFHFPSTTSCLPKNKKPIFSLFGVQKCIFLLSITFNACQEKKTRSWGFIIQPTVAAFCYLRHKSNVELLFFLGDKLFIWMWMRLWFTHRDSTCAVGVLENYLHWFTLFWWITLK